MRKPPTGPTIAFVGLITKDLRGEEQIGKEKAEQQTERGGGKGAQGKPLEEPI